MKKYILIFILILPIFVMAELSNIDPDFTGLGTRYIGMGESGIALLSNNDAIIHNPARLMNSDKEFQVTMENSAQLDLVNHNFVAYSKRAPRWSAWAVGAVYSGDEAMSDITGYFSYNFIKSREGIFSLMPRQMNLGLSLKYFGKFYGNNSSGSYVDNDNLNHQVSGSAHGFGIDVASVYRFNPEHFFTVVLKNGLSGIWWSSENEVGTAEGDYQEGKPVSLKLGYGYKSDRFIFTSDYQPATASDLDSNLSLGFEYYLVYDKLALRSGYKRDIFSGNNEKIGIGTGISQKLNKRVAFHLDIAYQIVTSWQGHNNLLISLTLSNPNREYRVKGRRVNK